MFDLLIDGYKADHRRQYPVGTTEVYSNFTPRSSRIPGVDKVVFFGLQAFIKKYLIEGYEAWRSMPNRAAAHKDMMEAYLGPGALGGDFSHIDALQKIGYIPLEIKALPEGTAVPLRTPMFTVRNTHPDFFWLPNFIETIISASLWQGCVSATIAREYRKILDLYAMMTGADADFVDWQAHDFSFRGMSSLESAELSGGAHLLSFTGTDTVPAIAWLQRYYNATGLIGGSVAATEHSVMCAGSKDDETGTFKRLVTEVYPSGIVSIVSDTWDLWKVLTSIVPSLKNDILARDGKMVIRPDCYDSETEIFTARGWIKFPDLLDTDRVASVDDRGEYSFERPSKIVNQPYTGDMIHFVDGKGKFDLLVTPNHRMVYERAGSLVVKEAEDLCLNWGGSFLRAAATSNDEFSGKPASLTPFERLQIAFQADGSYTSSSDKKIRFSFAKQRKIDRLIDIIENCGFDYKIYSLSKNPKYPHHSDRVEINVSVPAINDFSKDLAWVGTDLAYHKEYAREFIEEVSYWDCTRRSDTRFKFDSVNSSAVDKIAHMAMCAGYGVKRSVSSDDRSGRFSDIHTLHIMKDARIGFQAIRKYTESYSGTVHCVTVNTGRILVRRNGCIAVSGNSGDPVNIICGDPAAPYGTAQNKGVIELLWDTFGGTMTNKSYKVLDSHVGAIYGDSITLERCSEICRRLMNKGFASSNIVFGVGSYTYQYNTRDTIGAAMKATNVVVNGEDRAIFKDPVTDDGTKRSARGLLRVENGVLYDNQTREQEAQGDLVPVFRDGKLLVDWSLDQIRAKVNM